MILNPALGSLPGGQDRARAEAKIPAAGVEGQSEETQLNIQHNKSTRPQRLHTPGDPLRGRLIFFRGHRKCKLNRFAGRSVSIQERSPRLGVLLHLRMSHLAWSTCSSLFIIAHPGTRI